MVGAWCWCGRFCRAGECHRLRQFRHRGAADHGGDGDLAHRGDVHRGCQSERPPDGAGDRPAGIVRLSGGGARGRAAADDAGRRGGTCSGALRGAGAVGAGEIGSAAGRVERAGADRGDRGGGDPRSYRTDAGGFWRRGHGGGDGAGPGDHPDRPAGAEAAAHRGAARSVFGGLPGLCGADRAGVGCAGAGDRAEPDAGGAVCHAARDGGRSDL